MRQHLRVQYVIAHEGKTRCCGGIFQKLLLPRGEIIVGHNGMARPQQPIHEVTSDKAGPACDEKPQGISPTEQRLEGSSNQGTPAIQIITVEGPGDSLPFRHRMKPVLPDDGNRLES